MLGWKLRGLSIVASNFNRLELSPIEIRKLRVGYDVEAMRFLASLPTSKFQGTGFQKFGALQTHCINL